MPRPPIERSVAGVPRVTLFKPAGVPARELEQLQLAVDELEAIRLVDLEGLSHEQAAEVMGVSRQTVGRVLERGRAKVAEALVARQGHPHRRRTVPRGAASSGAASPVQERWVAGPEPGAGSCPRCGSADVGICWGGGAGCGRGAAARAAGTAAVSGHGGGQGRGGEAAVEAPVAAASTT